MGVLLATGLIVGESLFGVVFAAIVAATNSDAPLAIVEDFGFGRASGDFAVRAAGRRTLLVDEATGVERPADEQFDEPSSSYLPLAAPAVRRHALVGQP